MDMTAPRYAESSPSLMRWTSKPTSEPGPHRSGIASERGPGRFAGHAMKIRNLAATALGWARNLLPLPALASLVTLACAPLGTAQEPPARASSDAGLIAK